ncbi:MAG: hypothetical protein D6698_03940 [Gammaproteobacteria bacterium]|nr:MAG: hypothetical protein D6698_03940 [Gammaproteobacteria bacterium]
MTCEICNSTDHEFDREDKPRESCPSLEVVLSLISQRSSLVNSEIIPEPILSLVLRAYNTLVSQDSGDPESRYDRVEELIISRLLSGKGMKRHGADFTPLCRQSSSEIYGACGPGFFTGQIYKKYMEVDRLGSREERISELLDICGYFTLLLLIAMDRKDDRIGVLAGDLSLQISERRVAKYLRSIRKYFDRLLPDEDFEDPTVDGREPALFSLTSDSFLVYCEEVNFLGLPVFDCLSVYAFYSESRRDTLSLVRAARALARDLEVPLILDRVRDRKHFKSTIYYPV